MSPFVHIFLGHERDRFEITPVISSNVEYVAVALCGRLWGTFLGYLKENLDKFQGKQVLSHSFPKMKSRPFDAVLLRRDGGNREVPPGGWAAPEDHERVLRSVIRAGWPDREPTWPAFLEGGAVLRITDADANNWLPRALRSALAHWRYRRHNPPPPQPQPPHKRRRR